MMQPKINADDVDYEKIIDHFTNTYGGSFMFTLDRGAIWMSINNALFGDENLECDKRWAAELNKIIDVLLDLKILIRSGYDFTVNVRGE